MNTLVKYQINNVKNVLLVFYAIMILISLMGGTFLLVSGEEGTYTSGTDISSAITFFIVAICCFSEIFQMWIQNGVTRENIFKGFFQGTIMISAICSVIDCILTVCFSYLPNTEGVNFTLSTVFSEFFSKHSLPIVILINALFIFVIVAVGMMAGYFISSSFYRAGKHMRVVIAAGLPIFVFVVLPMLLSFFHTSLLVEKIISFLFIILGFESGNPFYLLATIAVVFVLLSTANYFIIKRLEINTHS